MKFKQLRTLFCATALAALSLNIAAPAIAAPQPLQYLNPALTIDERVADLLSRMTLEEKAAQMMCLWNEKPTANKAPKGSPISGPFSPELAKQKMPFGIGQLARQREMLSPREWAEYANAVQKWLKENTRLGIPAVFHDEILHGNMSSGSTVFPVPIAMAASWDPEIVGKVYTVAARQTRHRGSHHVLGPNMDLAREARWGRTPPNTGDSRSAHSR